MGLVSDLASKFMGALKGESAAINLTGHLAQAERVIERTKDARREGGFVDMTSWTAKPERPTAANCTTDLDTIQSIYRCLGIIPGASFEEIEKGFHEARMLLDQGMLVNAQAPEDVKSNAAKAIERIELAYRLLASPRIREYFTNAFLSSTANRGLSTDSTIDRVCAPLESFAPPAAKEPFRRSNELIRSKKGFEVRTITEDINLQDTNDTEPIRKESYNSRGLLVRIGRVAALAAVIGGSIYGYFKNRDKVNNFLSENVLVKKVLDYADAAKSWMQNLEGTE